MSKRQGSTASDGSVYITVTDGSGNLKALVSTPTDPKQNLGNSAPDGSKYATVTNGSGSLT